MTKTAKPMTNQARILAALSRGPLALSALADAAGIDASKMTRPLNALEVSGKLATLGAFDHDICVVYSLAAPDHERKARALSLRLRAIQARKEADQLRADARELSDDADRLEALAADYEQPDSPKEPDSPPSPS